MARDRGARADVDRTPARGVGSPVSHHVWLPASLARPARLEKDLLFADSDDSPDRWCTHDCPPQDGSRVRAKAGRCRQKTQARPSTSTPEMMEGDRPAEATGAEQARRDLLAAMNALESELASSTGDNESLQSLEDSFHGLRQAFDEHKAAVQGPQGLLAELAASEPRLRSRVDQIQSEHSMIVERAEAVAAAIPVADHDPGLLSRIEALLSEINAHSQHLVSLIYEAVDTDIPAVD